MSIRTFISSVLLAVLLASCYRPPLVESDTPQLHLVLELPATSVVKADTPMIPASSVENQLYDLRIWVFESGGTHPLVVYKELNSSNSSDDFPQAGGGAKHYSLPVTWDFARKANAVKVDVFVLANASSFGYSPESGTYWKDLSWGALMDASFGGEDYFSPSKPISSVPDENEGKKGLPMSGIGRNLSLNVDETVLSVPGTVILSRAVSKIRFLFSQTMTDYDDPSQKETLIIDKIELNGLQFPTEESIFSLSPPSVSDIYVSSAMTITKDLSGTDLSAVSIPESASPEWYAYAGQNGSAYEARLQEGLESKKDLVELNMAYLRESDKSIKGKIYYSIKKGNGDPAERPPIEFNMPEGSLFERNQTWIVYGYFISQRTLQISINVLPWNKSEYTIQFNKEALMVTEKLTIVPESVAGIFPTDTKDHFNVYLYKNSPAKAYLRVATPQGGTLKIFAEGEDKDYFIVSPEEAEINPGDRNGRIDIQISRNPKYASFVGKTITLGVNAYIRIGDDEQEIPGASEAIDQVYHLIGQ